MMFFIPLIVLFGVIMALRLFTGTGHGAGASCGTMRSSCGTASRRTRFETPKDERYPLEDKRDPLKIVRERYARGEIDYDEFERYLDTLLAHERPDHPDNTSRR